MKRINNTIYADDNKVLLKGGTLLGKEYNLNVTFFSADGTKLSAPIWEDESYLTEAYDLDAIKEKKLQELAAYDASDELNKVTINNYVFIFTKEERSSLMNLVHAKINAGDQLITLWYGVDHITLPVEIVQPILEKWELHASDIYQRTAMHRATILSATDGEELLNYRIELGYPEPLDLTIDLNNAIDDAQ